MYIKDLQEEECETAIKVNIISILGKLSNVKSSMNFAKLRELSMLHLVCELYKFH